MADPPRIVAVLAEFQEPDTMIAAAKAVSGQGWRIETFTPFPVPGLKQALGFSENKVPVATLIGGIVGAATGFLMQVGAHLDFPLNVGGRPLIAVPAFMLITFELMVLFAVFAGIGTMMVANRLPKLHHPLFDVERFGMASDDRFFLAIIAGKDGTFDHHEARAALWRTQPVAVSDVCEERKA